MILLLLAWKNLPQQQLISSERSDAKGQEELENQEAMMDCLKAAASNVFDEFLSDSVRVLFCM